MFPVSDSPHPGSKMEQAVEFVQNSFNGQSFAQQLRQKNDFIEELYKQIGKLKYEVDWLKKKMGIV